MYQILACGSNGNYQLGQNNNDDQYILKPSVFQSTCTEAAAVAPQTTYTEAAAPPQTTSLLGIEVKKIACGGNHTLILFENGDVYSCGSNEFGQTGHDINKNADIVGIFKKIETQETNCKWTDISCTWESSFLVNDQNELYCCGNGLKGELGLGSHITKQDRITFVKKFERTVLKLKSSMNHTVVQTAHGELYGWGNCRKGQLGKIDNSLIKKGAVWRPTLLSFGLDNSLIDDFQLGREYTAVISYQKKSLQLYGKSVINMEDVNKYNLETSDKIENLESMWSSIHYKLGNRIKSFGVNSHGQLFDYIVPANRISPSFTFKTGSEHGLVLIDNVVYAWGWGEHGNCGKSLTDPNKITFDYLNPIFEKANKVHLIAGGCATSWVVIEV
ncbi:ATS1 [Candida oxycetoniae]|uniref:ATS1 n=1 Tax=Candida oxycetoniae TaxID=497107 RepID=A0AAI9SSC4_9ASCO|nr:ATS1 [Candida oxycetoniae]KAI3402335.1 ATS1 [Candida oxycetoniae]